MAESAGKKKKKSLGRQCAAYGCYNTFYKTDGTPSGLHFFRFPQKNPEKSRWCNLIKRVDGLDGFKVTTSTFLCEKHFSDVDIKRNPNKRRLVSGAKPSLNLYSSSVATAQTKPRKPPLCRSLGLGLGTSFALNESSEDDDNDHEFAMAGHEGKEELIVSGVCSMSTQTEFSFVNSPVYLPQEAETDETDAQMCNEIMKVFLDSKNLKSRADNLMAEIQSLNNKVIKLESRLADMKKSLFSIEKLKEDNSAVKFYTGYPNFSSLLACFEYFEPKLNQMHYWHGNSSGNSQKSDRGKSKRGRKRSLTHLEEFILVLMRLKVGLFVTDLADRFGVSTACVSRIFTTWICFLYHELPILFPFPSQELVRQQMPAQFKDFPNTRLIIDCTEIFIEVPSSMKSQSQTWSEYKHHNTWKVLVGISPAGCITFVSKLWSGKVSDKEITKKSGVLALLENGDNIMADRGFDIKDILPPGVSLNIPPFKGARAQLTAQEVEDTACIASVRIHVERAIGRVKNYHILDGVLPLSLSPVADQIFTVCCLLTNFLPFLVNPKDR